MIHFLMPRGSAPTRDFVGLCICGPLAAVGPPGFPLAESRNGLREVHAEPSHYQWAFGSSGSGYQPGAACVVGAVVTSGMRAPRPSTWFRMPRRIGRHLGSRRCNSRTSSWSAGHPQQRSPPMLSIDTATRSQFGSFVSRLEANPRRAIARGAPATSPGRLNP